MATKPPYYRIFLLTVWHEQSRGPPLITWRFRLEDPRTGRQHLFADAAMFMTALQKLTVAGQGEEEKTIFTSESIGREDG